MTKKQNDIEGGISELAALGKRRIGDFVNLQTEVLDRLHESQQQWFDRAQSEADLASEFSSKLASLRSFPDVVAAYQEWNKRRFEMMAEDGKQTLANIHKLMEAGAHLFSDGWRTKNAGTSKGPRAAA